MLDRIPALTSLLLRQIPNLLMAVQGHHGGGEGAVGVPGSPGDRRQGLEEPNHC